MTNQIALRLTRAGLAEMSCIAGVGGGVKRGKTGVMILVAEDNEVNQIVLEQILTEVGHSYTIVENGKLAVERFKELDPDLILMDVKQSLNVIGLKSDYSVNSPKGRPSNWRNSFASFCFNISTTSGCL